MKIKIKESNGILGKSVWPTATSTWRDEDEEVWSKLEKDTEIEKKLYKQLHKHFGAVLKKGPPLDSESIEAIKQIVNAGDYGHVFQRCPKGNIMRGIKAPIEWVMKHAPEAYNSIPTDREILEWSEVIPVNFTYKPQGPYGEISSWTGNPKTAKQFSTKYRPDSVSVVLHADCSSGLFIGSSTFSAFKGGDYQYDDGKPIKKLNPNPHEKELLLIGDCQVTGIQFRGPRKSEEITTEDIISIIKEELEAVLDEKWSEKYKRSIDCDNPKGFSQRAHCAGRKKSEGKDPKKGTGKKPPRSGRRLYTDEDPSDTVSVKFRTASDIRKTLSKKSFKSKSHKRQSQIINLIHQRARAAYRNAKDPKTKARLKRAYDYAKKRKEASKAKTKRMRKNK